MAVFSVVTAAPRCATAAPFPTAAAAQAAEPALGIDAPEPALERLAALLGPTLEANRRELRGVTGAVRGFGAGSRYPQIWVRDSATLLPVTRYLYPRDHLESWLAEHFAHQKGDGSLYDWVAAGPVEHFAPWAPRAVRVSPAEAPPLSADKNTVESDQESSAVLAALGVYRLTGDPGWLQREVAGTPLLERCQRALQFLMRRRHHAPTGLVTSGFAADWGDVSPVHPDQRAIYLDDETPRVLALYTNALFYGAATALRDALAELGFAGRAAYWEHVAGRVAAAVEAELWQERRGFYRMHRLLEPRPGAGWDDAGRFALGGNAVAALHGLADPDRVRRLMDAALAGQQRSGVSTIAGVLHPPFPRGFFRHPALAAPYRYQNGGQWDWFAGRLLLAAFEAGDSERAYRALVALGRKAAENDGLYEWHTRSGEGEGSAAYAGSAGALGAALIGGLYGVTLSAARLELRVRLGGREGGLELREPATGTAIAYRQRLDGDSLLLELSSNHPHPGRVALRLPPGQKAAALRVGKELREFESVVVGHDTYAAVDLESWGDRRIAVELE